MLAARITCPRCGRQLTVTENAPAQVTCPVCLAALVNPASPLSGVPRPVPVIPLDRQVARDTRWVTWLVFILLALLAFVAIVTISRGNARGGTNMILMVGGLATFVYFFGAIRADTKPPPAATPQRAAPPVPAEPGGPAVLEYGVPRRPARPAVTVGAVTGGFFSAIGVCALGFFILATTVSAGSRGSGQHGQVQYLSLVAAMVLIYVVMVPGISIRWRGFAPGAIAGLCLGMLALGPCAACYLLSLQ